MSKLFGLRENATVTSGILFRQPFFRMLKKHQIIKTIPYFFKQENEFDADTDHRIFCFSEIQRKIIYGIMRRMYSVIGENILEMLTLI